MPASPLHTGPATNSPARVTRNHRVRRSTLGLAMICVILGLLIWAKLQMVVTIPRRVLAEPKEQAQRSSESMRSAPSAANQP